MDVNNPENSSTTKVREHIPPGILISTISLFRSIEISFCEFLREDAIKIINFKKKKMKLLTNIRKNRMKMQKFVKFVKKNLRINIWKI